MCTILFSKILFKSIIECTMMNDEYKDIDECTMSPSLETICISHADLY